MIDKIIEELTLLAKENLGYANSNMTEQEMKSYCSLCLSEVEEIVKKYENNNWIKTKDQLPHSNYNLRKRKEYLTCNINNVYMLLPYCEGWNCTVDEKGVVYKVNEIDDIIAWREIEEYEGE